MKKIAIIHSRYENKLTEFLLQAISFYYVKDAEFHIFTNDLDELINHEDILTWDNNHHPKVYCRNIKELQLIDYVGFVCIRTDDLNFLKTQMGLVNLATHYQAHNTQAIVIKNYNESIQQLELLLKKYHKQNKQIETFIFTTLVETPNEIENRIIQDLSDFGYKINLMTFAECFELPVDQATLIITAPNTALFPILNLTCGKYLIKEIINDKYIITVANTVNYHSDPQKLISNLRKIFNYIINHQYDTKYNEKSSIVPYSAFAEFYEIYMKHVDYNAWSDFIIRRFEEITGNKPISILEIACGTAAVSRILKDKDYNVEACDIVPEMLDIARYLNRDLKLFQADMTNYSLTKNYDLIISLFDSVNYILNKKSFELMLRQTYENLSDKGVYIFDISTFYNSTENFDGYINVEDNKENFLLHRAEFLSKYYTQETELNLFSQKFNIFVRDDEIHEQKVWMTKEIIDMINNSDFTLYGIYDIDINKNLKSYKSADLDKFYSRLFFVLQK